MMIGVVAVAMMVVMCGGMIFLGHGIHKHGKKSEGKSTQEVSVKQSTGPVSGQDLPHTEHGH